MADTPIPPPPEWRAAQFRLTVFLGRSGVPRPGIWDVVAGAVPTSIVQQPAMQTIREEGPFASGSLVAVQSFRRYDLLLTPPLDPAGVPAAPLMEDSVAAAKAFATSAKKLLQYSRDARPVRVALGSVVMEPVENRDAGYIRLAQFLPAYRFEPGISEFLLQVNRRRQSKSCPGHEINRLSKWSVVAQRYSIVTFGPPGTNFQPPEVHQEEELYFCRCEVDINNTQRQLLEPDTDLDPLFDELMELATEIQQKGPIA